MSFIIATKHDHPLLDYSQSSWLWLYTCLLCGCITASTVLLRTIAIIGVPYYAYHIPLDIPLDITQSKSILALLSWHNVTSDRSHDLLHVMWLLNLAIPYIYVHIRFSAHLLPELFRSPFRDHPLWLLTPVLGSRH